MGVTRPKENLLIISKEVDEFIKEYYLNEELSDINDKSIEKEINYLEDTLYIEGYKYNLYKKDLDRIENKLLYEINEEGEIYLKKKKEVVNNLIDKINNNKKYLSLIKEEKYYRKMVNKK